MPAARNRSSSRAGRNKRKSQNTAHTKPLPEAKETPAERKMAIYGITRVPVDYYHYGPYRYTNLDDALSQAKRENG